MGNWFSKRRSRDGGLISTFGSKGITYSLGATPKRSGIKIRYITRPGGKSYQSITERMGRWIKRTRTRIG